VDLLWTASERRQLNLTAKCPRRTIDIIGGPNVDGYTKEKAAAPEAAQPAEASFCRGISERFQWL
jgi:hypothetical protein